MTVQAVPRQRSVGVFTLGCRLNQFESDGLLQRFIESGRYTSKPIEDGPDIAIINTCTVTDQADSRNRSAIRRILNRNPSTRIVVTGCFAQTDRAEASVIPGVGLVVGNDRKSSLLEEVDAWLNHATVGMVASHEPSVDAPIVTTDSDARSRLADYGERPPMDSPFAYGDVLPQGHTRAYLKIQDGCDRKCTYCKIPMARGPGVSRPVGEIIEHVQALEEAGAPEIVLTGVNLGWYRDRKQEVRFISLLERIVSNMRTARLRLSSIEPCDVDAPLAELTLADHFCDFLHVPMQSGSSQVLKRMRRTYSGESFRRRIETVLRINPDIFVGTDVIVGFPGETQADFEMTLAACRDLGIAKIHGFRYSPRRGTPAAGYADQVPREEVRDRMESLQAASLSGNGRYARRLLGQTRDIIVEKVIGQGPDRYIEGWSDNYLRVRAPHLSAGRGEVVTLRLDRVTDHTASMVLVLGEAVQ